MKTVLVVDSTFYMNKSELENLNIKVVPLTVHLENITYEEVHGGEKTTKEVFDKIYSLKKLATTSQPTTNSAVSLYKSLIDEGYDKIISMHLSSKISGTYQGMINAAQIAKEESKKDVEIHVFDSKTTAQAAAIIASEVAEIIISDGDIDPSEVSEIIEYYNENIKLFFTVETLDFLVFGGRIPAALSSIVNLFGVLPMLTLQEGEIEKYAIVRSPKKALKKILEELEKENFAEDESIIYAGAYTTNDKMVKKMMKSLLAENKSQVVSNEISPMGIVIANHIGPNAYGLGWSKKYFRK